MKINKDHHLDKRSSGVYRLVVKGKKISLRTKDIIEARQLRDEYLHRMRITGVVEKKPVFGQVCMEWWDMKKASGLREVTLTNIKSSLNHKLLKASFVNEEIVNITAGKVERWWKLELGDVSNNTKYYHIQFIGEVFKYARKMGYTRENIMDVVDRPKRKRTDKHPFSVEEVDAIINAATPHWKPFFVFKFHTGCRTSEQCGLKWNKIDFVAGTIHICEGRLNGIQGGVKNDYSNRKIPMSEAVRASLLEQRKLTMGKSQFVFVNECMEPIRSHTFQQNTWKKTLKKANVQYRPPRNSRHTFISHATKGVMDDAHVAKVVGHADTSMIHRHYKDYVVEDGDISKLDRIYSTSGADTLPHQEWSIG